MEITLHWLAQKFELTRGGDAQNVRPMEGMRGFAVFLVFLVHYVTLSQPWLTGDSSFHSFTSALHTVGNTGVDLFFVLSGYLIYGSLISRPHSYRRFIARRVARIYPAFVVVFAIYVMLSFVFSSESKIPSSASAAAIYLIQNFLLLPGLFAIEPMITVAWSLSYEMLYYLVMPVAIALFGLRGRSIAWRAIFFSAVALAVAIYCAEFGGPVRLIMFVAGVLVYEAMDGCRVSISSGVGLVALTIGLLATLLPISGTGANSLKVCIVFMSFFAICLACFRHPNAWLAKSFSWTPLRWLGNMSYSYYLLHGLTLKAAFLALAIALPNTSFGAWFFWALLLPMFVVTLVPAALLFLAVERPFSLTPHRGGKILPTLLRRDAGDNIGIRSDTR